jgi:hypothetical protein
MILYGLVYFQGGEEVRLLQIGGDGRLRLGTAYRKWWSRIPKVKWEVIESAADAGQTYESYEMAMTVINNLNERASA